MTKLAANLTMLFNEVPFLERFGEAAKHGFKGVEFLFPYDFPAEEVAAQLKAHNLEMVLHNLPAGDWAAGERGIACHPDRVEEFKAGVDKAISYAKVLGTQRINCLVGIPPAGVSYEQAEEAVIANLSYAAEKLKEAGIPFQVEACNTLDIPGFFINNTQQALDIIAKVGSDNLFYQYDIYHMQRMEGELANTIKANLAKISHLQLADNPGRFEPGTGEINYGFLFKFLDEIGYTGWIGCEYKPKTSTAEGLSWRAAHGV